MILKNKISGIAIALCGTLALSAATADETPPLESAPVFDARKILPPDLLMGSEHRVAEKVVNDGAYNIYQVHTRFGSYQANSTEQLKIRVRETYAIAAMRELQTTDEFLNAVGEAGVGVVKNIGTAITDPIGTTERALSGVGKMFQRLDAVLSSDEPQGANVDTAAQSITGVSQRKREYAAHYGVDVYSSNPQLQENLDRLASASAIGGLGANVTVGLLTGPVITVTQTADVAGDMTVNTTPIDLRILNRDRLASMNIPASVVSLFFGNEVLSPTHQTLIVKALHRIKGATGRDNLLARSIDATTEDLALYRQVQAELYAAYHERQEPIVAFDAFGNLVAARTRSGAHVIMWPVDYLSWTGTVSRLVTAAGKGIDQAGTLSKKKQVWLSGGATKLARAELEKRGWDVRVDANLGLGIRN